MGTIRKKGLAVCMIALLSILGMTVSAERPQETEDMENIETLSGGDAAGEQIMPYAAGDIASGTDGGITWVIDSDGKLTISGTGNLTNHFGNENSAWRPFRYEITSASINVTGMTDASALFMDCSSMTSVDLSGWDTSSVTNMMCMFDGCSSLTTLDVSRLNTSNVTDMISMFHGCSSLTNLDVSHFNTSNVVNMSYMFGNCASLTELNVSNFDTSRVGDMSGMFSDCSRLTSLDISGFDLSSVDDMSSMFLRCSSLSSLNTSGLNTNTIRLMGAMFAGCSSLTSLDMSGFDTGNADDMTDMFYDCNRLTTLYPPYNVNFAVLLPDVAGVTWSLPDGTEITELPQGVGTSMILTRSSMPEITTTTPDLNMEDVVRVKYVPYSYTVETNNTDPDNIVEFSVVEGRLAEGLQMYPATGEIYGVPTEAGEFRIRVMASYSNPAYLPSYADLTLTVLDNTDGNVGVATDPGYDITQPVIGFDKDAMAGGGDQTLVSQGEYSQFRAVYIDGRKLTEGQDYTSAPGSTRITIMNQTLADGGTGTHTLGIEFRTETGVLKRAAQNYVVSSKTDSGSNTGNSGSNSGSSAGNGGSGNQGNSGGNTNGGNSNSALVSAPTELPQQDFVIYIVERGDSLWNIAVKFYGQGESWKKIYNDNAAVIRNPNRLYAGQKLIIRLAGTTVVSPAPEASAPVSDTDLTAADAATYTVQKGDMLWSIAYRAYGDGKLWTVIYAANRDIIKNPECIRVGQVIRIPQR